MAKTFDHSSAQLRVLTGGSAEPRPRSDQELVEALRRGDPSVAEELHDRVRPQILRTLGKLLRGNPRDHELFASNAA